MMKLQCSCGAKYAFDATPEMLQNPVKFICPNCGLDASDYVNELIRQEFNGPTPPPAAPAMPAPAPSRLRISHEAPAAAEPAAAPVSTKFCAKHRERAVDKCRVCEKPICPKCMELFGYFCSPLCKGKAEAQKINVPVYAGQRDQAESAIWRRTGLIAGVIVGLVILFFGAWTWYAWFGSVPHPYFSVRFEDNDRGYYGTSQLVGKDQIVFLHGGTLARYDMQSKKPVWSVELISKDQLAAAIKAANAAEDRLNAESSTGYHHRSSADDIERSIKQALQAQFTLRVSGQNIWVSQIGKLTRYEWDSGRVVREVSLPEFTGELVENGDELQVIGAQSVTHINLASGDSHVEQFSPAGAKTVVLAQNNPGAGLPGAAGDGTAADPKKLEAQAQNLNIQGRIALPALLSNARHEQQLENALNDDPQHPKGKNSKSAPANAEYFQLVGGTDGLAQLSTRLLEEHIVSRSAMQAPPKKSVLDGDLNASKTTDAANEILNEMQRNKGGDVVTEDQSRYQATVHLPQAADTPDWTGEVVGKPHLFVLKTVNILAAGKTMVVLDKSNKKLWQASFTYPVISDDNGAFLSQESPYGAGPCVERGSALYVFDQAVLTCYELGSGNARWRLPSVGVVGLFFDDQDNVYVNTTTGNPDEIKYSRQIDISRKTEPVLYKLEPKTGKTLWTAKAGGFINYLSGKFIYVMDSYDPNPTDADVMNDMMASLQKPAYLRIARLQPSDGHIMWEYYDRDRCPVNARFDKNSIELVFKREVQVLRYLTF